jgi:hypothetical protein
MAEGGGVPEPLLPPQMALQNPELVGGHLFHVLPRLGRIVFMLDADGDENYVPYVIPLEGGFPEPLAEHTFQGTRAHLTDVDDETETAYFTVESREESLMTAMRVDLEIGAVETLHQSPWRLVPPIRRITRASFTATVTRWARSCSTSPTETAGARCSTALRSRSEILPSSPSSQGSAPLTAPRAARASCSRLPSSTTPARRYLDLASRIDRTVTFSGHVHEGLGELERIQHLEGDRFAIVYNIDGCSWAYDASLDEQAAPLP